MMRLRAAYAVILGLAGATYACSSSPSTDAGDSSTDDVVHPDGMPSEGGADGGDGGITCGSLPVEDLNTLGTVTNGTLTFMGNNTMTPDNATSGLQPSSAQSTACAFRTARERLFVYTTQNAAVLRVSTTNMGTDANFDTTLLLEQGPSCTRNPTNNNILGCNDDDPAFGGDDRRVSSTALTIRTVPAGTKVFIALGAFAQTNGTRTDPARETGNFVLTVQELAPVADGQPCDVTRVHDACGDTSTCAGSSPTTTMGTCQPIGSAVGTQCTAGGTCMNGLTCDPNSNLCVQSGVADGMPCDGFHTCGDASTCVSLERGLLSGVCRANGTVVGSQCRASGMLCDAGLTCVTPSGSAVGTCLTAATTTCSTYDSTCATGQSCLSTGMGGTAGNCTADGTVAGADCMGTTCSGANLTCTQGTAANVCQTPVTTGQACGPFQACPTGNTCYLTDLQNRYTGECFAPGALGGPCRTTGTACDGTATCSNTTDPTMGRCVATAAAGGMCNLTTACPTGSTCVRAMASTGSMAFTGTCVAEGSGGASCHRTGTPCDGTLKCSSAVPDEGVCQSTASMGGACAPRTATVACATGEVCRASSLDVGTCAAPTMEHEPNDVVPSAAQAVTVPTAISGGLGFGDVDCYGVMVPANGHVYASANLPSGLCPGVNASLALDLYASDGRLLGGDTNSGNFGCPRIDGSDPFTNFTWASSLSAGTYYVCVRNDDTTRSAVPSYVLSLSAQ